MRLRFTVPGEPRAKERPRVYNGHAFTPEKTKKYEAEVKFYYYQENGRARIDGEIEATINAYYKIPKSASKKKRQQMLSGEIRPTKKPDLDNVAKSILDALNGIAYHDDSAVVSLHIEKWWSDEPRVEVLLSDEKKLPFEE